MTEHWLWLAMTECSMEPVCPFVSLVPRFRLNHWRGSADRLEQSAELSRLEDCLSYCHSRAKAAQMAYEKQSIKTKK